MSEHQVYEFLAIDRPLSSKEMDALRAISTRAEISPTRFWNEYHWGDLKADPAKLVEKYFDAHTYFANWGTHRLMLRVPVRRVDASTPRAYFVGRHAASARVAGDYLIVDLRSESDERDVYERSRVSLGTLAPLCVELTRGDLRAAYLAWLLAVQSEEARDEDVEPPVPRGLACLTAAQEAMVDFLRIDVDLLAAAAAASAPEEDDWEALWAWTVGLAPNAKDEWLARALDDPDLSLGAELRRAFGSEKTAPPREGRRVAELRRVAEEMRESRERAEKLAREKAKTVAETARQRRLDALAKRVDVAWKEFEALVEKSAYDDALKLAIDLRDLAKRDGDNGSFAVTFEAMRKRQIRRRGFFDRWKRENEPRRW